MNKGTVRIIGIVFMFLIGYAIGYSSLFFSSVFNDTVGCLVAMVGYFIIGLADLAVVKRIKDKHPIISMILNFHAFGGIIGAPCMVIILIVIHFFV